MRKTALALLFLFLVIDSILFFELLKKEGKINLSFNFFSGGKREKISQRKTGEQPTLSNLPVEPAEANSPEKIKYFYFPWLSLNLIIRANYEVLPEEGKEIIKILLNDKVLAEISLVPFGEKERFLALKNKLEKEGYFFNRQSLNSLGSSLEGEIIIGNKGENQKPLYLVYFYNSDLKKAGIIEVKTTQGWYDYPGDFLNLLTQLSFVKNE